MEPSTPEAKALKQACDVFIKDLEALPEEAFTKSFAPKARTVADITYEVIMVNDAIVGLLQGKPMPEWPGGWVTAPESFQTKDQVLNGFREASDRVMGSVAGMNPDEMLVLTETPRGEAPKGDRVRFMALHTWYHSGQLNFIQTLLGDDGWHWS
ncbi:MAG: DinB family protein [Fimbriimonadaceae bacterium]|nr:DinB family protein [Fimbriimonadaceae bacterium]QYK59015.1 MAG: DinB family protein [Fimbriimonadaceae bacterium]